MAAGRWYPTVTPLRNGEMLITSGGPNMPEVRDDGGLPAGAEHRVAEPAAVPVDRRRAGRARVLLGPDQTMRSLDTTGTGTWQSFGQRDAINRDYGSHALYDIGKILVAGGGPLERTTRG